MKNTIKCHLIFGITIICNIICPTSNLFAQKLEIRLKSNKNIYQVGEAISVSIQTNYDCYLTLYDIYDTGEKAQIFPNPFASDNRLMGQHIYQIPSAQDAFGFQVESTTRAIYATCLNPLMRQQAEAIASYDVIQNQRLSEYAVVTAINLNVRKCASTSCNVIGVVPNGAVFHVVKKVGKWYQIQDADGNRGFVVSKYVKIYQQNKQQTESRYLPLPPTIKRKSEQHYALPSDAQPNGYSGKIPDNRHSPTYIPQYNQQYSSYENRSISYEEKVAMIKKYCAAAAIGVSIAETIVAVNGYDCSRYGYANKEIHRRGEDNFNKSLDVLDSLIDLSRPK